MAGTNERKLSKTHSTEFALKQTDRLSRTFGHIVWDEVAIREYKRIISGLVELYGAAATETAVSLTIEQGGFLDPARLRQNVPQKTIERRYCPRCHDSEGWLTVLVDGEKGTRRVKCQHQPIEPTMQVWIGPTNERRHVTATCCDYVDHFQP